jgi:hypothetical protein
MPALGFVWLCHHARFAGYARLCCCDADTVHATCLLAQRVPRQFGKDIPRGPPQRQKLRSLGIRYHLEHQLCWVLFVGLEIAPGSSLDDPKTRGLTARLTGVQVDSVKTCWFLLNLLYFGMHVHIIHNWHMMLQFLILYNSMFYV